jgi:hypothetical protein
MSGKLDDLIVEFEDSLESKKESKEKSKSMEEHLHDIALSVGSKIEPYPVTEEGYIDPSSRFRFTGNPVGDWIGRKLGSYLISTLDEGPRAKSEYDLFSKWPGIDEVTRVGEEQLVRSLFQMEEGNFGDNRVFDIAKTGDSQTITIADTQLGNEWTDILKGKLNDTIASIRGEYYNRMEKEGFTEDEMGWFLESLRGNIQIHPDTGETLFRIEEGLAGDVYFDADGNFKDYWNIGLDQGEKLVTNFGTYREDPVDYSNLQRFLVAPFTNPPVIKGNIPLWEENKDFLRKAFNYLKKSKDVGSKDAEKDPIIGLIVDEWLNEGYSTNKGEF